MLPSGNRLIFQYDGNVVIQVRGDSTLRVTGKPTIEAGTLNLKATQNLSLSAMNVEMKVQQSMSQSGTAVSVRANAAGEITSNGILDIYGSLLKIN